MPLTPEEPKIYESVQGTRSTAAATRTPQASRTAAPVPAPRNSSRPASPRPEKRGPAPGGPGAVRNSGASAQRSNSTQQSTASTVTAQIELVGATDETAVDVADETVDKLLDDGTTPGDILLVTTGEQHPWAQHELSFGEDSYWRQLADGSDVFCVGSDGLQRVSARSVVLLAVNGGTDAQAAEALPAALAKAGKRLIVCGDPRRLRDLL